ncbi:DNA polymerase III subunit delta [Alicyclobacillus contaminans]|uniref:DNA polymerase III subunit delta n=1 Tax=Alicyclobacillus contaminans TaxID=392016 RepID=UPI0003F5621B|nr:DNA polymerase III subunit delta [Alicyclobacillus contaminans]GMA52130.1 DNA polymerase III subunit delta [Alicyclobacillus contaminans]
MQDWDEAMAVLGQGGADAPVHVLVGTDDVLMRWYTDALLTRLSAANGMPVDVSKYRFEEQGCSAAVQACQTVSLFSAAGVVILDHCTAFLASQRGKVDVSDLEQYLQDPVPGKTLVITVRGDKVDERKKLSKLARKHIVVDCNPPKDASALKRLQSYCASNGIGIAKGALAEVWRRTQSLTQAVPELHKLAAYTDGAEIRMEDVGALVTPPVEDNVFGWIDSVVKGDAARAFGVLADVQRAGYDSFALYALIARQLRLMWYAKVLQGRGYSQQQIAAKAGAHPYAVKVATEQAKGVSTGRLERLLTILADAEFAVKSGRRTPEHTLDMVVMACTAETVSERAVRAR